MIRRVLVDARFLPSLDAALDKVLLDTVRPDFPEFGLAPCRPNEMLEITIRRVVPKAAAIPFHPQQKASSA